MENHEIKAKDRKSYLGKTVGVFEEYSYTKAGCTASKRELQIINLLAKGLSTQEISVELNLSEHTISTYRKKMIRRTRTKNTVELVALCVKKGLI